MKTRVSVIRVVQLRTEYINDDGKLVGWNKKFQKPTVAAEHWARNRISEWENRKFDVPRLGHRMGHRDWEEREAREKKLYRRSLPIFKRMLGITK